jgi:hypothetical protein
VYYKSFSRIGYRVYWEARKYLFRRLCLKISRLLTLIAFLAILAMATHMAIDEDTWWHLRSGQWMVENHSPITTDPFSYTRAGEAWRYPGQWIQIGMYLLYNRFGPGGINLWVSLMVTAIFIFVWKSIKCENLLLKIVALLLAAASSAIYWAARPYLVGYLLAAAFFFILLRRHRDRKGSLWLLPILMLLWVNSHGSYLAGFLMLAPYLLDSFLSWLAERRQKKDAFDEGQKLLHLVQISLVTLGATLLNPDGLKLWTLPFTTVKRVAEQLFILEWQSPDFHQPYLVPFLILLAVSLFSVGAGKKRPGLAETLMLAGFGATGLYAVRNIFFFVIVSPSIITPGFEAILSEWKEKLSLNISLDFDRQPTRMQGILNWVLLGAVALVVFVRVYTFLPEENNREIIETQVPVEAAAYIHETQPEGRLFNAYNFGGYCIWALPEYPVFVDGRADLHGDEIILEWYRTVNLSGNWQAVLDEWDIGVALLEPSMPLARELVENGWQIGYQDDHAVVLVKD